MVKQPTSNAMILRGREIAYEAANSPTIPSSMPNYTHDQIRDIYGELDKKTRRLQENEYILHTPMIDAWKEKSPWNIEECPLPKFRIEKNDQTILMAAYLSTGLSNKPQTTNNSNDDKELIHGSFRTAINDRTTITPSPNLFNVHLDFDKLRTTSIEKQSQTSTLIPPLAKTSETMDLDSLIDLDEETTIPDQTSKRNTFSEDFSEQTGAFDLINDMNEKQSLEKEEIIVDNSNTTVNIKESDILFPEENDYHQITSDLHDAFEELYQRYITNFDQYDTIMKKLDEFEQKQDFLTPISEEPVTLIESNLDDKLLKSNLVDEYCLTLTVKRQSNHIGHYGFELEQTSDRKIKISSIINSDYCPNLDIGDEILNINNHSTLITLEQCHLLLHSLWSKQYDSIQITVRKPKILSK